ncbi:hypothetical protein ACEWPM_014750 [Roseovarius sp. S4756]|uniref:hypothetical protein n=1 Tax=Roseovarius maritimus TaxID=3342637 RepID=UPI00372C2ED8
MVLLADHQTTGGYSKIAGVIAADLPALGRITRVPDCALRPYRWKRRRISHCARAAAMAKAPATIQPLRLDPDKLTSHSLLATNLISGVIGAAPESE